MTARVLLSDDYYTGPGFREVTSFAISKYDAESLLFEIPVETLARWEDAEAAYRNMQDEIASLIGQRGRDKSFARPSGPVKLYTGTWRYGCSPGLPS
jgi:hypothetical protein